MQALSGQRQVPRRTLTTIDRVRCNTPTPSKNVIKVLAGGTRVSEHLFLSSRKHIGDQLIEMTVTSDQGGKSFAADRAESQITGRFRVLARWSTESSASGSNRSSSRQANRSRPAGPGSLPLGQRAKASRRKVSSLPRRIMRALAAAALSAKRRRHTPDQGGGGVDAGTECRPRSAGRERGLGWIGRRGVVARPAREWAYNRRGRDGSSN